MNKTATLLLSGAIVAIAIDPVIGHAQSRVYIPPKETKSQLGYRDISGLNWRTIAEHYAPAKGISDWRKAIPARHWKEGYSAYQIAHAWENANPDLPPAVAALFYGPVELLAAIPEHKTPLPGGRAPSRSDILAFIRIKNRVCAVTVEGKTGEGFNQTVGEWSNNASDNKVTRLKHITAKLGLAYPPAGELRYQLLHRTAAAVIEAKRFNADCAGMIVHSFSPQHESFGDFATFLNAFGIRAAKRDKIYKTDKPGMTLYFGWASPAGTVAETVAATPAPAKPEAQPAQTTSTVASTETVAPSSAPATPTPAKSQSELIGENIAWILLGVLALLGIYFGVRKRKGADTATIAQPEQKASTQSAEVDNLAATVKEMHDKLNLVLVAMDSTTKIREIESRIMGLENKKNKTSDDESYRKGLEFEKCVVRLFDKDTEHFTLLTWSGDKGADDGIYPKNAGDPDLQYDFSSKGEKSAIAVECKWRSGFGFGFANDHQVTNYKQFEDREGRKTFIVLGVGGEPSNPSRVFVIPVSEINSGNLPESKLAQRYEQENEKSRFWYHRKAGKLKLH